MSKSSRKYKAVLKEMNVDSQKDGLKPSYKRKETGDYRKYCRAEKKEKKKRLKRHRNAMSQWYKKIIF